MSQTHHFMLGLLAQTSIHAGADSSTSVVDLPIQREGHSGLPCIFGSAVKGALRARAELHYGDKDDAVIQAFGAEFGNQTAQAGALGVGDARLLLMPIRSLTSQFKWVTCEAAIKRYMRDCQLLGIEVAEDLAEGLSFSQTKETVYVQQGTNTSRELDNLFLEEFCYEVEPKDLSKVISQLARLMDRVEAEEELKEQLVIVSNDAFTFLVSSAIPVAPHIAIESDTKIVRDGALWYEETLPPETLLYVPILTNKGRSPSSKKDSLEAAKIAEKTKALFEEHSWLQLGGNETVGMGWCAVSTEVSNHG